MQVIIGIYHHLVLGLHGSEIRWIAGSSFNPPSPNILQARRLVVSSCTHQTDWLALHNKRGISMPDRIKIEFAKSQQDRSKRTLDDILEAASNLIEQADPDLFTSRILAVESGYSLGTLNKRLISVENVFIWLIEQGQKKYIKIATRIIEDFEPSSPLRVLIEHLIDTFFNAMKKINPKVIRYYEHRVALKIGFHEDFDRVDAVVKPLLVVSRSNTSNTFRQMNEIEMRLILRSLLFLVERPFVYDDPIAGTMEHRRIAIENSIRLLGQ